MGKNIKKTYWYRLNSFLEALGRKTFSQKIKAVIYTVIFLAFLLGNFFFILAEIQKAKKDVKYTIDYFLKNKERELESIISDIENKAKLVIFSYLKNNEKNLKYYSLLDIDSVYIRDKRKFLIRKLDINPELLLKNYRLFKIKDTAGKEYITINIQKKNKYYVFISFPKFKKLTEIRTLFVPNLNIPIRLDIIEKNLFSKEKEKICSFKEIPESNLFLIGCVNEKDILMTVIVNSLLKEAFVFIIVIILVSLIYNNLLKEIIVYPLFYLKEKIEKMNKIGLEHVEFELHKYTNDEFGEVSEALEKAREKLLSEKEKLEIVKETTEKMSSFSTDLHHFALYVANSIDKLLDAQGSVILLYSKIDGTVDLRAHSNRFLENRIPDTAIESIINDLLEKKDRNAEKYYEGDLRSIYGIKKEVNDEYFLFHIIFLHEKSVPKSEDLNYIHTILNHLIYNINLLSLATYDPLTKLYNRRFIVSFAETEVKEALRYDKDLSVIILDIDNFKGVNDTYGHPAGDEVLKKVANILKTKIRETDKAGRYGGEEFIVILPNTPSKEALEVAERIRKAIEQEKVIIDHKGEKIELKVTASIGVASLGTHGKSFYELLKAADIALYEAKRNGKNQVRILTQEHIQKLVQEEFQEKHII
ncbi:MAG: GGDEF domain-containing protein, partial [Aquificae bacterium]|nr:GGDEF domain-containing protein [Aquificota bacterium]